MIDISNVLKFVPYWFQHFAKLMLGKLELKENLNYKRRCGSCDRKKSINTQNLANKKTKNKSVADENKGN